MKAFEVSINKFVDKGYYCGETASKARYIAYLDIVDVRPSTKIMDVSVRRAPQYDHLAQQKKRADSIGELVYAEKKSA